mmetsp:Transcript_50237/g.92817  ORF Transcript_50237/g.92817 Transcript_50237/m.92817 type:complete len:87 (+) Transcript_50237:401-661(+)
MRSTGSTIGTKIGPTGATSSLLLASPIGPRSSPPRRVASLGRRLPTGVNRASIGEAGKASSGSSGAETTEVREPPFPAPVRPQGHF